MITEPTPIELASRLYRLNFPSREFAKLPETVQASYISDAKKLLEWMREVPA